MLLVICNASMSEVKLFVNENLPINGYANLNRQRKEGFLCDVELTVEGKKFPAHRNVLAASCDYFSTMFRTNMREKYNDTVTLKEVSYKAMEAILDYIYSGKIKLSMENVSDILQAASMMQIAKLLGIIDKYLMESVDPDNALWLKKISSLYSLNSLQQKIETCICKHFDKVCHSKQFVDLTEVELEGYLQSDDICVESEDTLFTALVTWTNHDLKKRKEKFSTLLSLIRLQLVSMEFLSNTIRKHVLVKEDMSCRDLVEDAMHFHFQPDLFQKQKQRSVTGVNTKKGCQPPGQMFALNLLQYLPGFSCPTISITYDIKSGIQSNEHPNPGQPYHAVGFPRKAFLPDNTEGRKILKLLKVAWDRKLIFTIGRSVTSGMDNCVIWNDIPHKTTMRPGTYGYPDPQYFTNVAEKLKAKGVTEADI